LRFKHTTRKYIENQFIPKPWLVPKMRFGRGQKNESGVLENNEKQMLRIWKSRLPRS
jgi:hypothetical protein